MVTITTKVNAFRKKCRQPELLKLPRCAGLECICSERFFSQKGLRSAASLDSLLRAMPAIEFRPTAIIHKARPYFLETMAYKDILHNLKGTQATLPIVMLSCMMQIS